jgi:hypothetical protein
VVVCSPTTGALGPHNCATGAGQREPLIVFSFFFENFAPPFPEKDVRDENIQKKSQKIIIDFICETCDLSRPQLQK